MSHILIEKSFRYKVKSQTSALLDEYYYNETKGYWLDKVSGLPLMRKNNEYKPRTKKADVETGEDRKGE
jgi:hypothetical protein